MLLVGKDSFLELKEVRLPGNRAVPRQPVRRIGSVGEYVREGWGLRLRW